MTQNLSLASEFPAATETQWRALVDGVLKGASFDKLVSRTRDGIAIAPLASRRADAAPVLGGRGIAPWKVVGRVDHPDAGAANTLLREELEGAADTVLIVPAGAVAARGFGLPDLSAATLDAALANVHADLVSLRLEAGVNPGAEAKALADWLIAKRYVPAALRVAFGLSPRDANLASQVKTLQKQGFAGPFVLLDGRQAHEAGASEAEELAFVLANAAAALRTLTAGGLSAEAARAALHVQLVADQDQFLTIAKFRAMRLLFAQVEAACGLASTPLVIGAETAWRMSSRRDPYVNVLRATVATFAAGVGGADAIHVLPFTAALGLADEAARRLARNTNLILLDESNLWRVADPAAGAGSIEALTDDLAAKAWAIFQEIEAEGLEAAITSGSLGARFAKTHAARLKDIANRRQPITGTSEFPNVGEAPVEVLMPLPAALARGPFPALRDAEPFEALRDRADALTAMGKPARVFLANLGRIADFNARATFAKNAFEAGGIAAIGNDGFFEGTGTDLVCMTDALKASGARIACLCSSDAIYAEEAEDAAMALIASGATAVFLAGKPGDLEARLRAAGVSGFLVFGMDLVAFLSPLLD